MDTTTTKKAVKKNNQTLKDSSTTRIIGHLVYRHRVGLLIFNNVILVSYFAYTNLFT